jgi:hypothetical protein
MIWRKIVGGRSLDGLAQPEQHITPPAIIMANVLEPALVWLGKTEFAHPFLGYALEFVFYDLIGFAFVDWLLPQALLALGRAFEWLDRQRTSVAVLVGCLVGCAVSVWCNRRLAITPIKADPQEAEHGIINQLPWFIMALICNIIKRVTKLGRSQWYVQQQQQQQPQQQHTVTDNNDKGRVNAAAIAATVEPLLTAANPNNAIQAGDAVVLDSVELNPPPATWNTRPREATSMGPQHNLMPVPTTATARLRFATVANDQVVAAAATANANANFMQGEESMAAQLPAAAGIASLASLQLPRNEPRSDAPVALQRAHLAHLTSHTMFPPAQINAMSVAAASTDKSPGQVPDATPPSDATSRKRQGGAREGGPAKRARSIKASKTTKK